MAENQIRIGVIRFSSSASVIFHLNTHFIKEDVINAVDGISYPGGGTYTDKALQLLIDTLGQGNGGRADNGVPQIGVVITDGKSNNPSTTKSV